MPEQEPEQFESRDFRGLRLPMLAVISLIIFMAGIAIYGLIFAWNASAQWSEMNAKLEKIDSKQDQMGKDFRTDLQTTVQASQYAEDQKISSLAVQVEALKQSNAESLHKQDFQIWVLKTKSLNAAQPAIVFPDPPDHSSP